MLGDLYFLLFGPEKSSWDAKKGSLDTKRALGDPPRGLKRGSQGALGGRSGGGWGLGVARWGEKGRKRAHEHQTSFKTMFGGSESPKIDVLPRREQNAFSKTSSFYAPIWPKMGWRASFSANRAETRTPAHFGPNRSVKTRGFGKRVLLSPR